MNSEAEEKKGLPVVKVRLVKDKTLKRTRMITDTESACAIIQDEFAQYDREVLGVLNISAKGEVINMHIVSIGDLTSSVSHPREVFKASILSSAGSVILFHNHPSGDPTPSAADFSVSKRLCKAGEILGIPVLDHIVIGSGTGQTHSMKANGDLGFEYEETMHLEVAEKRRRGR